MCFPFIDVLDCLVMPQIPLFLKVEVTKTLFILMKSVIKAKDKLQKACKRAAQSSELTLHRQQQNKVHMASVRAALTPRKL